METFEGKENRLTPERKEALLLFESIKTDFIERVRLKIESEYTPEKGFKYHHIQHTELVVKLTEKLNAIGEEYGLQDEIDSLAAVFAAWAHDVELVKDPFTPAGEYKRLSNGESEQASLSWLKQQLGDLLLAKVTADLPSEFQKEIQIIYTRILEIAEEAIIGTTPSGVLREVTEQEIKSLIKSDDIEDVALRKRFWDHTKRSFPVGDAMVLSISQQITTLSNPNLASFNVTSADLFQVATMTSEGFAVSGDGELHESSPFILENEPSLESLDAAGLEKIRFKVISHVDFQPGFVEEQWMYAQKQMESNIQKFSEMVSQDELKELIYKYRQVFPNFKARMVSSLDRCDRWRQENELLYRDPLQPGNKAEDSIAFSAENRPAAIELLRKMINETRVSR